MESEQDYKAYEASDEASENELLERSLSVWRGWSVIDKGDFEPVPLDIYTASSIGQYDCVRSIISKKEVDIDRKNKGGWTPLMYACYIGHDNIVNLLLDARVNVNLKNHKGQTPLMLAASCGNESVGYFLARQGADIEVKDKKGWTALFHATCAGHQNMVRFLLKHHANMNAVEPSKGMTPFIEAAGEGHEIIVQLFLQYGVNVNSKNYNGETARSLALMRGHIKIVSLIDNHVTPSPTLRPDSGLERDFSSSDEGYPKLRHHHGSRPNRCKNKGGPNIRDGPEAFARLIDHSRNYDLTSYPNTYVPEGYVTFSQDEEKEENHLCYRDVTSPINPQDHNLDSSGGKDSCEIEEDGTAFSKTGALTIKSSSESSGGLAAALGISRENSLDSDDFHISSSQISVSKDQQQTCLDQSVPSMSLLDVDEESSNKAKTESTILDSQYSDECDLACSMPCPVDTDSACSSHISHNQRTERICYHHSLQHAADALPQDDLPYDRPEDLASLLQQLGLVKYMAMFDEQDVDLQVFLSLTDNDLKELGIKLFGPRRKMTNAIARWHSNARPSVNDLEQAYADKLEAEMQEMAIQLHHAYDQVEKLNGQILQEQELRSVTESCLMEERAEWQHQQRVIQDIQHRCDDIHELLKSFRMYHAEAQERIFSLLHVTDSSKVSSPDVVSNNLIDALKMNCSLEDTPKMPGSTVKNMSSETLVQKIIQCTDDMQQGLNTITLNMDTLICRSNAHQFVPDTFS